MEGAMNDAGCLSVAICLSVCLSTNMVVVFRCLDHGGLHYRCYNTGLNNIAVHTERVCFTLLLTASGAVPSLSLWQCHRVTHMCRL